MTRTSLAAGITICLIANVAANTACSNSQAERVIDIFAPSPLVEVSPTNVLLQVGETRQLSATVTGSTAGVDWESADPLIASVSADGLLRCNSVGATTVRAILRTNRTVTGQVFVSCNRPSLQVEVTARVEFDHVIGRSPCPQTAGRITIRGPAGRFTLRPNHLALGVSTTEVEIAQDGGEVTVDVIFLCNVQESFLATISVFDAQRLRETTVNVVARVTRG